MPHVRRYRRRRGLTLLECLVAIVVLAVGVISGVQCLNAALLVVTKANRVAVGTAMVRESIENVIGQSIEGYKANVRDRAIFDPDYDGSYTEGTTQDGRPFFEEVVDIETSTMVRDGREQDDDDGRPLFPGGERVVRIEGYSDSDIADNLLSSVTVTVRWNTGRGTEDVQLSTLVAHDLSLAK